MLPASCTTHLLLPSVQGTGSYIVYLTTAAAAAPEAGPAPHSAKPELHAPRPAPPEQLAPAHSGLWSSLERELHACIGMQLKR